MGGTLSLWERDFTQEPHLVRRVCSGKANRLSFDRANGSRYRSALLSLPPGAGGLLMPFTTPVRRLVLVLLMAAALDGIVAKMMAQTMDEGDHIGYGVKILRGEPDRSDLYLDSKTPITALNALPRVI